MHINEVEQQTGIAKKNIRFYEKEGLLCPARNGENGYREYTQAEVDALQRIKLLRKLDVPIGEIRTMLAGQLTLAEGMQRHRVVLERQRQNLEQAHRLCQRLSAESGTLAQLDTAQYLEEVQTLEQSGTGFVDIAKQDIRIRYVAPVIITICVVLLGLAYMSIMLWAFFTEEMPLAVLVIMLLFPLLLIGGVVLALKQRMKEIKKGDDADAVSKY